MRKKSWWGSAFAGSEKRHRRVASRGSRTTLEILERRELLTVVWANENSVGNAIEAVFGDYAQIARATISRAIADWNSVITSFNYAEDNDLNPGNDLNDEFELSIIIEDLAPTRGSGTRGFVGFGDQTYNSGGVPTGGTVRIDNDGGEAGWFFDSTPLDDAEFVSIADVYSASFTDIDAVSAVRRDDLYRTVLHEIGHALGITNDPNAAITSMLTPLVNASNQPVRYVGLPTQTQLTRFASTLPSPLFGVTATFVGGHIYEGSATYLAEGVPGVQADPATVYELGSSTPLAFQTHPNELLNSGTAVPAGNYNPGNETVRQFISDLDAMILADAYGYTVTLPSTLNNAHVTLDPQTGTLLVQGRPRTSAGAGQNEAIDIALSGSDLVVTVTYNSNSFVERVPAAQVRDIVIHQNAGTDSVNIGTGVATSSRVVT